MVHMRLKKRELLFKIDMEKGYDFVDWPSISYLFERMGFGTRWKKWMKACVEETIYSMLVNGSPTQPMATSKRLRQGDPLSTLHLHTGREGSNKLVEKTRDLGIIKGFKV